MVNRDIITNAIDRYGETVKVITASQTTFSDWGDRSQTTSSSSTVVIHNDISGDEEFNREGRFRPGDKIFFAKGSLTAPSPGDQVVFDSNFYEIKDVITHNIENENKVHEIRTGRIE